MTFITIDDELKMGLRIHPGHKAWVRDFYDRVVDEEWFERRRMPLKFTSEWERYEWLFKRAIAGYVPGTEDFRFMHRYEISPEYGAIPGLRERYEQLKYKFAAELRPVFGTMNRRRMQ